MVLAARGTGGLNDLMKRRLHEGEKQQTPTGIPGGALQLDVARRLLEKMEEEEEEEEYEE